MINYFFAILYGLVQGMTEFLPVSSSGHLILLHRLARIPIANDLAFDVSLHLATLTALIIYFRKDIISIIVNWFNSTFFQKDIRNDLGWFMIIATVPAVIFGLILGDLEDKVRNPIYVAVALAIVGFIFIAVERNAKKLNDINKLGWKGSLLIGVAQSLALIPGVSRSGITIITGMALELKREEAVRFSMLLAIPVIFGASIIKIPALFGTDMAGSDWSILIISFSVALISGWLAIRFLLKYARTNSLVIFAYYRLTLAIMIFVLYFLFDKIWR
jgi:undecaprenyl-diphosphatase